MKQKQALKINAAFSKAVAALDSLSPIQYGFMSNRDAPESSWLAWEYLSQVGIDN